MAYGTRVFFDPVREVAFGSVTANYTALGTALNDYGRIITIVNSTDAEIYISIDGVTNHLRLPGNSFKLIDLTTNRIGQEEFFLANRTQFFVKRVSGAPTTGSVWIEIIVAKGGK